LGLLRSLSESVRLVGWLAGRGRPHEEPELLIGPFLTREAVLSSSSRGPRDLGVILAADAGRVSGKAMVT
jgi:hypothetical protein